MDRRYRRRSIVAHVRILGFLPELRREFLVAGVDPMRVGLQNRIVRSPHNRHGKGEYLGQPGADAQGAATDTAHNSVATGRRVAFVLIDLRHCGRQFSYAEEEIRNTAAELPGGAVVVGRRVVNIAMAERRKTDANRKASRVRIR